MTAKKLNKENIKLTIIDDESKTDECYYEIIVNRNFLNTLVINQLIEKTPVLKTNVKLTERENEVLIHIAKGKNNEQIAHEINVSIHTIKLHLRNIFQKLEVKDRTEAVVKAIKYNLIDINF